MFLLLKNGVGTTPDIFIVLFCKVLKQFLNSLSTIISTKEIRIYQLIGGPLMLQSIWRSLAVQDINKGYLYSWHNPFLCKRFLCVIILILHLHFAPCCLILFSYNFDVPAIVILPQEHHGDVDSGPAAAGRGLAPDAGTVWSALSN